MAGDVTSTGVADDGGDKVAAAHHALRADPTLQFRFSEYTAPPQRPPPQWLLDFARWLEHAAPVLRWVFWIGIGLIAALILFMLVREILRRLPTSWGSKETAAETPKPVFKPTATRARALLEEADRLAAEGRYSEAVRVLLHRSIEDIERAFPVTISPAQTSREIARLEPLSTQGRTVFTSIAQAVETSLFGGRALDAQRFAECRAAYASFALGKAA